MKTRQGVTVTSIGQHSSLLLEISQQSSICDEGAESPMPMLPEACRSPDAGITSETRSSGYFRATALHLGLAQRESDRNGDAKMAELLVRGVGQKAVQVSGCTTQECRVG
jgi:hypothetical protein